MALSNAIVPVLPAFATDPAWEGAIYAAYFLGAFLFTLPGGILADRYGKLPILRAGLILTVISGILLIYVPGPLLVICLRLIEGFGAGLFIAAGMSYVNSQPNHIQTSGYYLATLNLGLVVGLAVSGWLAVTFSHANTGIAVFSGLSVIALAISLFMNDIESKSPVTGLSGSNDTTIFTGMIEIKETGALVRKYSRLLYSAIILIGITGVATSLYPTYSGYTADIVGLWIAGMSVATIITVMIVSNTSFPMLKMIRLSAILMAAGIILTYKSPLGFIILGSLAGVVMVAQMFILADETERQGHVMGLFSTSSYLGMTILPFLAGIVADYYGYFDAFLLTAVLGCSVALIL